MTNQIMFKDEVTIKVQAGKGGDGHTSFHREKFIARGGPDGGDGGDGGDVVLRVDNNLNTLSHLTTGRQYSADPGGPGGKNDMHGKSAEDLILKVTPGTKVIDVKTNEEITDLVNLNEDFVIAKGGRGGYGNAHFTSSTRQAPQFAELGEPVEKMEIRLELALIADVGLIGLPSVGKSTLIAHISNSKPKIAEYHFTTLAPNLGVVSLEQFGGSAEQRFVAADVPGLIEGASEGKGLGHDFLKHVNRSGVLIHILDATLPTPIQDFNKIQNELEKFDKDLVKKVKFIAVNKSDTLNEEDQLVLKDLIEKELKKNVYMISAASGDGLKELFFDVWNDLQENKKEDTGDLVSESKKMNAEGSFKVYRPHLEADEGFTVQFMYEVDADGLEEHIVNQIFMPKDEQEDKRQLFHVTGKRISQIVSMTDVSNTQAVDRVYDVLKKMKIYNELVKKGAKNGDYIKMWKRFFEFHE